MSDSETTQAAGITPGPWAAVPREPEALRLKRPFWIIGQTEPPNRGVAFAFGADDANARLIASAPDLLYQNERLRESESSFQRECERLLEEQKAVEEQRDAMAKALQAVEQRLVIEGPPPQMMALCANAGQRLGAATAWDWLRADLRSKIEAALQKAGR